MIVFSAIITTEEGKGDRYIAEFKKLAPKVRKDPGCITYVLHRMADNPDKFLVYEQYENKEAINYHTSTPHFQAYREATTDIVKSRDITRWKLVE